MMTTHHLPPWTCQFPISLAIEGRDCFKRMADAGIETVLFCTMIYAPYRLVLPRYPQRGIYSLEEGLYFYRPDPKRYKGLPVVPAPSQDFTDRDLVAEMVAGAHQAGLKAGVWVTLFANGRTAKLHPDWAVENLYGSRDRLFLDFDHPEVREYSLRVCEEIVERYAVDEVMLDKFPQTCLEQNSFAGRIDPVLRTVGSFCFSKHAVAAAKNRGLDLKKIREQCRQLAAESLAIPPHVTSALAADLTGDTEVPLLMLDNPWIMDVLNDRVDSIRAFAAEVRKRLDAKRRGVLLSAAFVPQAKIGHDASSPRPWLAAQSYKAYAGSALELIHCVVHWGPEVVEYDTRRAVDAVKDSKTKICTHIKAYGSTRPDELPGLVATVKRGGAHGVAYFCYDLMSEPILEAARQWAHQ
ncbi:MAG: family 10 glycosylhydrolase [Acidobacteria bacterium]|nr:family 10 glycosylhydrolase [Acidobacteriota bacterium]